MNILGTNPVKAALFRHSVIKVFALILLLAGCASIAKPQSFDQQLAYVQGQITAVRQTTLDLMTRERITVNKALSINADCDKARSYVKSARTLGDTPQGQDKLQLALSLLLALETQLKEYQ